MPGWAPARVHITATPLVCPMKTRHHCCAGLCQHHRNSCITSCSKGIHVRFDAGFGSTASHFLVSALLERHQRPVGRRLGSKSSQTLVYASLASTSIRSGCTPAQARLARWKVGAGYCHRNSRKRTGLPSRIPRVPMVARCCRRRSFKPGCVVATRIAQ